MSDRKTVILSGPRQVATAQAYVADRAFVGWLMSLSPPSKKRIQEEKYHAMFGDIAEQCVHPISNRHLTKESWKRLLVEAMVHILREEARAQGKPDPFPEGQGVVVPSLDGMRVVQVEVLTRNFTVAQASTFIEYLYAFGAEHDVKWTEPVAAQPA